MLFIWGSTAKLATISGGHFFCPTCKSQSDYALERVSRYFTFFFIPLFPTRTIGEYIRCKTCQTELRPEVLNLTREQIEQATALWDCPFCGNRNPPTERACLSCGTARHKGPPPLTGTSGQKPPPLPEPPGQRPPPLPGVSRQSPPPLPAPPGLDVLTLITSPPPLSRNLPARYSSSIPRIILIVVGVAFIGLVGLIALAIKSAHDEREHPEKSAKKPGQAEFEAASNSILTNHGGVAYGNTPEAREMAGRASEILGVVSAKIPHMGDADLTDMADGKFIVFCQLNKDSCVFLIHVPNLRHYTNRSQQEIAKVCYVTACAVLKGSDEDIKKVAVATRGMLLFDRAMVGGYPAPKDEAALDNLQKLEKEGAGFPDLYPFFIPETTTEKAAPDTATPAAPSTPASQEPPAASPASATPSPSASASPPASMTSGNRRPAVESRDAPSWVPIYPTPSKPPHGTAKADNGVIKGRTAFQTTDPLDKVKEFYESKLKTDGFEVTEAQPAGRLFEKAEITGRKDDGKQTLRAEIVQMKAMTLVTVTFEGPEPAEAAPEKPQ